MRILIDLLVRHLKGVKKIATHHGYPYLKDNEARAIIKHYFKNLTTSGQFYSDIDEGFSNGEFANILPEPEPSFYRYPEPDDLEEED